jgi:hypothetical protein
VHQSTPARFAVLLVGPTPDDTDRKVAALIEFLGVPCRIISIDDRPCFDPSDEGKLSGCGLIMSASTAAALLQREVPGRARVLTFVDAFSALLIYGLHPSVLCREDLRFLTQNSVDDYLSLDGSTGLAVSNNHRNLCGAISGICVENAAHTPLHGIRFQSPPEDLDTLLTVDGKSIFARLLNRKKRLFLSTGSAVVDVRRQVSKNFDAASEFVGLVPYMIFARDAFPEICWKSKKPQACLIIDDPPLHARYGFLNFRKLLQCLGQLHFAANLAFIPWNARRSRKRIADRIRATKNLALCIHGCDHRRAEFGSRNEAWLDGLTQLAVERMENHRKETGVPYQKIMVFPQGVFSNVAMGVLKRRNFIAAVNTEVVPNHLAAAPDSIALADLLDMAIMSYDSFPLFSRRSCTSALSDYALDLFLGKPCLLVAHHNYFRSGFAQVEALVSSLNQLEPGLKWRNLGSVLSESYTWRQSRSETVDVRMFANQMTLENSEGVPIRFEIKKPESDGSAIERVVVNDTSIAFDWDKRDVSFSYVLRPRQKVNVRMDYKSPANSQPRPLSLSYRLGSAARRYLCDARDNYLFPLQHYLHVARN